MSGTKLKIGLLINNYHLYRWQEYLINEIMETNYCELVLVIKKVEDKALPEGRWQKIKRLLPRLGLAVLEQVERRLFRPSDYALASKNVEPLLAPIDTIEVITKDTKYSNYFQAEDIERIKARKVDILLRFGFNILRGAILKCTRFGVWSYHHGDNMRFRGVPAGFWEMYEQHPLTGAILQVLSEELDGGQVLGKVLIATDPLFLSRNRHRLYWNASELLPKALRQIHNTGQLPKLNNSVLDIFDHKLYRWPKNHQVLVFSLKNATRFFRRISWKRLNKTQWIILYSFSNKRFPSLKNWKKLTPPKDRFWADPFLVSKGDEQYIFFEEMLNHSSKAHISYMTVNSKKEFSTPQKVLERDYHLSYPFLFEFDNTYYLIPETRQNNSIELFKAHNFPVDWKFERYLMKDVEATDTTIFYYKEKWWLFSCIKPNANCSSTDNLYLFFADNPLTGTWKAHPQNPIISDVRYARPAGAIFEHEGKLIRPSQDCALNYGYAINFNEIKVLSEIEYQEEPIGKIEPNWNKKITGTHTYNSNLPLQIIDARWRK